MITAQTKPTLRKKQKDKLVADARKFRQERWPDLPAELGWCLHSSLSMVAVLQQAKIEATLQAGSAFWRRATDDHDVTTFGYEYGDQNPMAQMISELAVLRGSLPEMHVWVGLLETQEIIDIETCKFPVVCRTSIDMDWPYELPPDYLWCHVTKIPDNCYYKPSVQAMDMLVPYVRDLLDL